VRNLLTKKLKTSLEPARVGRSSVSPPGRQCGNERSENEASSSGQEKQISESLSIEGCKLRDGARCRKSKIKGAGVKGGGDTWLTEALTRRA